MLRTQLRPAFLYNEHQRSVEGIITSFRQFSVTQQVTDQSSGTCASFYSSPRILHPFYVPQGFASLIIAIRMLTCTFVGPRYSPAATPRPGPRRRPNIPPAKTGSQDASASRLRPRPPHVIDARALAASKSGGQANVLRGPRLQYPRGGVQAGARKFKKSSPKSRRPRAPRSQSGVGKGDDVREAEIEAVYQELTEKSRPVPVRYAPQAHDFSTMREVWPSLPTDVTAQTAGVLEKLSSISGRFADGYIPPHELGKRLYQGQSVRFFSEEEKAQAIKEAKKLAQERADKLSQRKGDLVEPEEIKFDPMEAEDQKVLVQSLVQGIYPKPETQQADKPAVLGGIIANLRNNETYRTAGKSTQFLTKVESLLASSRPAKRA